jgi:hypothetical protein
MLNYGIDPERYKRDLHEILYQTYRGLANVENHRVHAGFIESVKGFFRQYYYRFKAASHRHLFKKYSLYAAEAYMDGLGVSLDNAAGEEGLDAWVQYYNAFESYPRRALGYLRSAGDFEVPIIPESLPSYSVEEGTILKNKETLLSAIPQFDALWERDMIAETYTELWKQLGGRKFTLERRDAAERLYALNRGALLQNGITLPVSFLYTPQGGINPRRTERTLRKTLEKIGLELLPADAKDAQTEYQPRFRLSVTQETDGLYCDLYDSGRGISVFRKTIPLPSLRPKDISAFAETLGGALFTGYGQ